jgi:hypothetical protein
MQQDEEARHAYLLSEAERRFGGLLNVSGYATGSAHERAVIDAHLADAGLIPERLVARVVTAGLAGVFVGVGDVPDLDDMRFLRGTSYEQVSAIYDRTRRYIVAGTYGDDALDEHNLLHEFGHAAGDLLDLNEHLEVLKLHRDIDFWIRLPAFMRGFQPGDGRGRRELFAESIRDRILGRAAAVRDYGANYVAFLEEELDFG